MEKLTRRLRFILFLLLIAALPVGVAAAPKKAPVGAVVAWTGVVYVDHADTGKRVEVEKQEPLYKGDTVITMDARAKLLMNDDSILAVGPNSALKVHTYETNILKSFRSSILTVSRGSIRSMVNRFFGAENSGFRVVTPNVTAGVKGTDFIIKETKEGTVVVVVSSEVTAANANPAIPGTVSIKSGYMSSVKPGMAPTTPEKTPEDLLDMLFKETGISIGEEPEEEVDKKEPEKKEPEKKAPEPQATGCAGCHAKTVEMMSKYMNRHPDVEKSCEVCHLTETGSKDNVASASGETKYPFESDGGLVFPDMKKNASYKAVLSVRDSSNKEAKSKSIDIGASLKTLTDDKKPPVVSDVKITEIAGGVFSTATIECKTDELARIFVEYGDSSGLGLVARPDGGNKFYSVGHKTKLERLKGGGKYYVRVGAEDVFGNKAYSETLKFKIGDPFTSKTSGGDIDPSIKTFDAVKVGDRIGLLWGASKPVVASVVLSEASGVVSSETKKDPHAPGLAKGSELGTVSCDKCHSEGGHRKSSHSIGRMNWSKTRRNAELPYDTLGNMMCSTCHPGHGSNYGNMLRNDKDTLCKSCHK